MGESTNITWHESGVTKQDRRKKIGHHSFILWFTGLSGSGKSTIANAVAHRLFQEGINEYVLDGDNIRFGLNKNLGFSAEDRTENIRRIGEVSKLFVDSGQVVLTAFISPFIEDRKQVREIVEENEFVEVYIDCNLEECERRDPKGLYQKARAGEIKDFTGISSPYESPENPEITVHSDQYSVEECVDQIVAYLKNENFI
ncbi:adenylyl-sulfate kinase [Priestia endophytica]|uniref:adenylyl-sulfate kinase n=1 Tax=Priestia endophytica TaxID=135735 RepID=UPI002280DC70|nr:adenylyl-sulfate kinase [Priestia endophytica]MCY8231614.1 adenylyl-sulfate kinase [Priestia endophytica]